VSRVLILSCLLCLGAVMAEEFDPATVAAELVDQHVPEAEWNAFVAQIHAGAERWLKEHEDGSLKWFLDDQITAQGLGATKDVQHLKTFVMWVALYHTYDLPVPAKLRRIKEGDRVKYLAELKVIEADFSWEKALVVVRRRAAEALGDKSK
jgi:hypothetical protein